ncbi:hypothetical protein B0H19DRAFT_1251968 [Mycena capillaripes]|nr:hypothetical protein B0H19DRAFT_1251968 [Mycena capillaripes]
MKLSAIAPTIVLAGSVVHAASPFPPINTGADFFFLEDFKGNFFGVPVGSGNSDKYTPLQTSNLIPNTPQTDAALELWTTREESGLYAFQKVRSAAWIAYAGAGASIAGDPTST